MKCSEDPDFASCNERCRAIISCGHRCQRRCTEPCNTEDDCIELIKVEARCGHLVQVGCCTKYDPSYCSQGRLHVPFKEKCNRDLVCGHICKEYCNYRCPPCKQKCDRQCIHGDTCKNRCGDSCIQCIELCQWECKADCPNNFKCEKLCMETCDRPKCNTLCHTILDCGPDHKCSGLLCECSQCVCKVCENLTEILFGYEDEDNAIFIRLEYCKCVLKVNGLDQYISNFLDNTTNEIKSLKCPKCSTKISKSKRYSNELKIINKDICDVFRTIRNIEEGTDLHAKRRSRYARQEYNEFHLEIRRLQLTVDIHKFKTELSKQDEGLELPQDIQHYLLKLKSIEVVQEDELLKMRRETEEDSSRMIGLTLKEKQMIKRTMENEFMGSGHWYKCKNGHYYSIGECGMPMEKIKCPQCGLVIGGADHILTDDNERAMDFDNL
ncbi:unnamed protein product [Mytilus coruscus]|uniref:RZ-type domain-containing protein n=1 Tax=Mytilus coruscus TaxID=42192 RepID=A0A6J8BJ96_MYTCO|nr:unnamed protein product [Mytilus coruscus]